MTSQKIYTVQCDSCSHVEQHETDMPSGWGTLYMPGRKQPDPFDICPACIKRLGKLPQ